MGLDMFKPEFLVERAYGVSIQGLIANGIRAVFVDLDNTLITWDTPNGTPEMREWLLALKEAQIDVVVISNNSKERVSQAVAHFGIDYEARANKPFTFGINRALKRLHLAPCDVIMIGDQLMTDIHAANRAGLHSVLVKPLVETDAWVTKFNRFRERLKFKRLMKQYGPMTYQKEL